MFQRLLARSTYSDLDVRTALSTTEVTGSSWLTKLRPSSNV